MPSPEYAYHRYGNHMLCDAPEAAHDEALFRCAICMEEKPESLCQLHPVDGPICSACMTTNAEE